MEKITHYEKTLTSEVLFEGRVITLTKDTALLENGKTATRAGAVGAARRQAGKGRGPL